MVEDACVLAESYEMAIACADLQFPRVAHMKRSPGTSRWHATAALPDPISKRVPVRNFGQFPFHKNEALFFVALERVRDPPRDPFASRETNATGKAVPSPPGARLQLETTR
jgi:hypothetical protein